MQANTEADEAAAFFDMLADSRRPLLYVGGGVIFSKLCSFSTQIR